MIKAKRLAKKVYQFIKNYYLHENREIRRISKIKRHCLFTTTLLEKEIQCLDSTSFIGQYYEIIKKKIYCFETTVESPYIVDCGANIGISLIFFITKFPKAEIVAFEPDPLVFSVLEKNLNKFNNTNITLINKGVWNADGKVNFIGNSDDTGKIVEKTLPNHKYTEIEVVRLRSFLKKKVHFLKIDIEGAEDAVLPDIYDLLPNIERIFIEYHSKINEDQKLAKILDILYNNGFRYFVEQTTIYNPNPFIDITVIKGLDNLLNIYGYRINLKN